MHLPINPQTRTEELYQENLRFRRTIQDQEKTIQGQGRTIQEQGKTIQEQGKTIQEQGRTIREQGRTIQEQERTIQRLRTERNHFHSIIENCTHFARDLVQRLGDVDRPPLEDRRGHFSGGDPRRRYRDAV
jgi:predicted RNase H-like nuclease (RuvC/YqgF family)